MSNQRVYFTGLNCSRGIYATPSVPIERLAAAISGRSLVPGSDGVKGLGFVGGSGSQMQVQYGQDPNDLATAGWGILLPAALNKAERRARLEALEPLLARRRRQAGQLYRELNYRPNESAPRFFRRHRTGPGPVHPEMIPYYLLIAASPAEVPYLFQHQLDVQYAVGRVHFDTLAEYRTYATGVAAAETGAVRCPREVHLFSVRNDDDKSTALSDEYLVAPLKRALPQVNAVRRWRFSDTRGSAATKAELARLLRGDAPPALLFTASHGARFDREDPRLLRHQGALICSDWPGPLQWQEDTIPTDFYFSADDLLATDARVAGMINFHFACYSAGTPQQNRFYRADWLAEPEEQAPVSFLAALPQAFLAHPNGGALAVVGQVDRAWSHAIRFSRDQESPVVFESVLNRLLSGYRLGSALEDFNVRFAELGVYLNGLLDTLDWGGEVDLYELVRYWTAYNDAQGYVIVGDPAVRLAVPSDNVATGPDS